ncbi:MAG TPA: hypothetical protein O0X70_08135 [Methanocorpusculum sp.]|nr:hypothetical protein [Methanocorpusculum sp.]
MNQKRSANAVFKNATISINYRQNTGTSLSDTLCYSLKACGAANAAANAANEIWLISANGARFLGECSGAAFWVFLL